MLDNQKRAPNGDGSDRILIGSIKYVYIYISALIVPALHCQIASIADPIFPSTKAYVQTAAPWHTLNCVRAVNSCPT